MVLGWVLRDHPKENSLVEERETEVRYFRQHELEPLWKNSMFGTQPPTEISSMI